MYQDLPSSLPNLLVDILSCIGRYSCFVVRVLYKYYSVGHQDTLRLLQRLTSNRFQRGVYPAEDFTA